MEVHGYYEAQIRSLVRDFRLSDDWDLSQWWNILSLEIEANVAPDGWGPFDVISVFGRIEVRYDCVWTGGCSMFDSANAYAFSRFGKLPKRLNDGRRTGYQGTNYVGDTRPYTDTPFDLVSTAPDDRRLRPDGSRQPMEFWQTPIGTGFFSALSYGLDGLPQTADDLGFFYFEDLTTGHCRRWGGRARPGSVNGRSSGETLMLDPACDYESIGANRDKPNPFRSSDFNPLINANGSAALPYRPAPEFNADSGAPLQYARGVYYPNYRLQQLLADGDLTQIDTRFTRSELAWNRGQSQQQQKELKELYADIEMFNSQLWLRIGYQTIVWGKTELFRNQDQFNPQDIGLSSLPSLEESRISLWALRGIWSFYDLGPINDVRLELAMNFDQYQSIDPGAVRRALRAPRGVRLQRRPARPRLPGHRPRRHRAPARPLGQPAGHRGGRPPRVPLGPLQLRDHRLLRLPGLPLRPADLQLQPQRRPGERAAAPHHGDGPLPHRQRAGLPRSDNALTQHPANQQLFAVACAASLAVAPALDPTACLANIFGSSNRTMPEGATAPRVVVALNMIAQGDIGAEAVSCCRADRCLATDGRRRHRRQPLLQRDGPEGHGKPQQGRERRPCHRSGQRVARELDRRSRRLRGYRGLLLQHPRRLPVGAPQRPAGSPAGCGEFLKTSCDLDGVDVLNMEGGIFFQAFPNIEGTFRDDPDFHWDTTDKSVAQPGTVGFDGGPFCTRFENGRTYMLPGCRGPGDPGYDPRVDGTTTNLIHPFTGQQFKNELAAVSWNVLMGVVGFSMIGDDGVQPQDFDPSDPFRKGACSFAEPAWCSAVAAVLGLSGQQRNSIRAGGNGQFGRRDFVHHSGGVGILKVDKSNVLGFSMDFAEDVTKSNWGVEFTWVEGLHVGDNDAMDGLADDVNLYRLTVSVDRPTFVNFLNANRTFFINTQWFVQYTDEFKASYAGGYAWDIFGVLAISTGYFQDRLIPSLTLVYFVRNNSFAVLPQVTYRFTENFQASFGIAGFAGRQQARVMPINGLAPVSERFGRHAYDTFTEPGLAVVRERDEIYMRIRYTF